MNSPYDTYHAVKTKITTKKGRIFKKLNWEKILDFSTVDQLTDYLKKSEAFEDILKDVKNDIHRGNLESVLGRYKISEIENLLHYHSGAYKEFLKTLLTEADLTDIGLILRKIARNMSLYDMEDRFIHSEKYTDIPYDKLLSSRNVGQFIENLRGTPYYNDLRGLTNEDAIKRDFHIEMKLYVTYYKSLLEKADKLNKENKKTAKDIIGTRIDILNVLWIYRAKNYYRITPAEMLNYSLEGGKEINFEKLKKLCFAENEEEFDEIVGTSLGEKFKDDLNNIDISLAMNYFMYNYLNQNNFENFGLTLSYIYMLDIIINNLTTITEGIKYHLPKDNLKSYLVYEL
ncbi:MAG TPA: V-type ATPase subunit [Sedimentibacter sp.]|jgi:V/A-type H+-transporting ATPase subunit C|nr:V-type ATPase subunit [Sedimentibacter sp.]HRC80890.1 V-type ATPase subunit [Sedimentibacter sp.]